LHRWWGRLSLFVIAAPLFSASFGATANAEGSTVTHTNPFVLAALSCTGEAVTITGFQQMTMRTVVDPDTLDAHHHFEQHSHGVQAKATLSGTQYTMSESTVEAAYADGDTAPVTQMRRERIKLTRTGETAGVVPGEGDDLIFWLVLKATVDANGELRSFESDSEMDCR
jgi:hypothetical protein